LTLSARDRFLIDLLATIGVRVGEALSVFAADIHFDLGDSSADAEARGIRIGSSTPDYR